VSARELSGMGWLAGLCFLLGVLPTPLVRLLEGISLQLTGSGLPASANRGFLWLAPVSPQQASYAALSVMLALGIALWLSYRWLGPRHPERRAYPWECGFGQLTPRMQWTATAFAMPLRRIFADAFVIHEEVVKRPLDADGLKASAIRYRLHVDDLLWRWFYEPVARALHWSVRRVGVIQSGHLRIYLAYSFFTLIVLLWVIS